MVLYHLDHSFGVLLVCTIVSAILLGVVSVQAYIYCARFWKDDKNYLKWMVIAVCILDFMHQTFCVVTMYMYLIHHFYTIKFLALSKWPVTVTVMTETVLTFFVQMFFSRRVFLLNRKQWWLTVIVVFTGFLQLGFGTWSAVTTKIDKTFDQYINPKNDWYLATLWTGSSAVCDLIITFSVIRGLQKSRTGFKTTDRGIRNLITFTFSTGAISSCMAVATMIAFLCSLGSYCLGFSFILCRVYSNSLLASLNQRGMWFNNIVNSGTESTFISSSLGEKRRGKMSASTLPRGSSSVPRQSSSTSQQEPSAQMTTSSLVRPAISITSEQDGVRQMEEAQPSGSRPHVQIAKSPLARPINVISADAQPSGSGSQLRPPPS